MNKTVKLLLYCTKAKPYLYGCYAESDGDVGTIGGFGYDTSYCATEDEDCKDRTINLNGTIVAEAECELVEQIKADFPINKIDLSYGVRFNVRHLEQKTCLNETQILNYLGEPIEIENGYYPIAVYKGYAIHLKNVKPFEEPKELSEYYQVGYLRFCEEYDSALDTMRGIQSYCYDVCCAPPTKVIEEDWKIKNAPHNMCYCEDEDGEKCILISIRPEWLCKILNGEKTIEVRKSILNIFKELIPNERN